MANVILNALRSIRYCHLLCAVVVYQSECLEGGILWCVCVIAPASNHLLSALLYSFNGLEAQTVFIFLSAQVFRPGSCPCFVALNQMTSYLFNCGRMYRYVGVGAGVLHHAGYHGDTPVTQEHQALEVWWSLRTSQPALPPVQAADAPCKTEADS